MGILVSTKSSNPEMKRRCKGMMILASLFGVGAPEALVIGVVTLLVFGPKGLAEISGPPEFLNNRTEESAGLLRMCVQCSVPKTYTSARGMVCPICGNRPLLGLDAKKKGSTIKDKEKNKRMRGQSLFMQNLGYNGVSFVLFAGIIGVSFNTCQT